MPQSDTVQCDTVLSHT